MIDVLILGAGLSGLTLAWRLEQAGLNVMVVDSRERVGGRTHGFEFKGQTFDLGATWVWQTEAAVLGLIDELGMGVYPSFSDGVDLYQTPLQNEWVRIPRAPVAEYRVAGGTTAMARELESRLSKGVRLGVSARRIVDAGDGVDVDLGGQTIRARTVVAAFPPALLGSTVDVAGIPADVLSAYRQTPVWMGEMAKVVAVYDRPFWRESGFSGRVFSQVGPMVETHDMSAFEARSGAALFGFVPRSRATLDWREAVARQLVDLFGDEAGSPQRLEIQAWWEESATTPPGPGVGMSVTNPQLLGHAILRRPQMGGKFHLASTETAAQGAGHLDGAVSRAEELARLLLS